MSTRSIVGVPWGDGVRGRYVHSDGYPSHMGRALWALAHSQFSGAELAELVCGMGPEGWSWITGAGAEDEPWGQPYGDHYGNGDGLEWWVTAPVLSDDDDHGGTEWGYALTDSTMTVFKIGWDDGSAIPVAVVRLDGEEPDWQTIEAAGVYAPTATVTHPPQRWMSHSEHPRSA
jgi:hypothetical protein